MTKILHFTFKGEPYQVNEQGHIKANGLDYFSTDWVFRGGTKHHWSNHISVNLQTAFKKPELLEGCLGFDRDHGTNRGWGGQYAGGLPRIRNAYVKEI